MKIICIGRNYVNHAKELGNAIPSEPVFFLKPDTAISPKGHPFFIPDFTNNVHYEVELVIKINRLGKHIEEQFAHKYYKINRLSQYKALIIAKPSLAFSCWIVVHS